MPRQRKRKEGERLIRKQLDFSGYEGEEVWDRFKIAAIRAKKTVSQWIIDTSLEKIREHRQ